MPNQCHHCGQTVPTPSNDLSSPALSTDEEISAILEQTQRLDDSISLLNARRAELLQRLNELRSSTKPLPPEILSTIFRHICPPIDFAAADFVEEDEDGVPETHDQITLGAVSRYWRQVVRTTPQLWTTATINVTRKNAQRKANLIQLYLSNTGSMPVSLALHIFPGHWKLITEPELQPIFTAIWEGAHKFKLLSMCSLPINWINWLSADFTHLEDLRLKWAWNDREQDHFGPQTTPLPNIPRLRQMNLWGTPICVPPGPSCDTVTILRLVDMPLHVCIQLLILCPNLVEYHSLQSSVENDATNPELHHSMTFPHMKVFHTSCSTAFSFTSILPFLQFPVLESFGLELGPREEGLEALSLFLRRLPTTWSTLEIRGFGYDRELLDAVFRSTPYHVQSLHLPEIDGWHFGSVLQALRITPSDAYMPGLRRIHINSASQSLQYMEGFDYTFSTPELFLDMLSERKGQLDGHFTLEIETDNWMLWEEHRAKLQRLVFGGFRLRILMSGKLIQCLQEAYDILDVSE